MTGRGVRVAGILLILTFLVGPRWQAAAGQEAEDPENVRVGLTYEPGFVPGLALTSEGEADMADVAARVDSILRRDLDYSDRFEILPPPGDPESGSGIDYGLWNQLGAVWLVTAEVSGSPDRPRLELGLHDVVYSNVREERELELPGPGSEGFRMAVHRAADTLVEWATGEPGMAATRIAFRHRRADGTSDVYTVDSDGRNLRQVTSDSTIVYSPAFSPDATRMLYVSYAEEERSTVYERDLTTGRTRLISNEPGVNITPTYRPDGERVLVAQSTEGGTEIFEFEADPLCCSRRVTTTARGDALNPSYSPDGSRIVFEATPLGDQQIYVQDAEEGTPTLISRYVYGEEGFASSPSWSPRGDRIAYQTRVDGTYQIASVSPDGSDRRILTSSGRNEDPSWAPDGRHLVFSSTQGGYNGLRVLDTVTGRVRDLTVNSVDQLPHWSPPIDPR